MTRPDFSILVPARNEASNIAATLGNIRTVMQHVGLESYEIVVVDDGSSDGTGDIVTEAARDCERIRLVRHPRTGGLGAALATGLKTVRAERFMIVPGDNDMSAAFIEIMVRHRDAADLVIAAPLNLEIRPYFRIILSLLYRLFYFVAFNVYVFYVNAPSVWPVQRVRAIDPKSRRFSIVSEINVKLLRTGCSFAEIPGYFSGGKPGGAATWRNLVEVVNTFLRMNWEIHVSQRRRFAKRPQRVHVRINEANLT